MPASLNSIHREGLWWFTAKLSLLLLWMPAMVLKLFQGGEPLYPSGIFMLINGHFMALPLVKWILAASMLVAGILYLFEKYMHYTTAVLSMLSVLIISYQESNGIYARAAPYSLVFIGQFIAYVRRQQIEENRVLYTIQLIAAAYTLAGITKVADSGINWFTEGSLFALQILKNYTYLWADTAQESYLLTGNQISTWLTTHPAYTSTLLALALILELFCLLALINGTIRMVWGLGLLGMHIGIAVVMGIGFSSIFFPMLIFFINPAYWIAITGQHSYRGLTRLIRGI